MQKQKRNKRRPDNDTATTLAHRRAYQKPVLVSYGDVRDVTLGPTAGLAESGAELTRRN